MVFVTVSRFSVFIQVQYSTFLLYLLNCHWPVVSNSQCQAGIHYDLFINIFHDVREVHENLLTL